MSRHPGVHDVGIQSADRPSGDDDESLIFAGWVVASADSLSQQVEYLERRRPPLALECVAELSDLVAEGEVLRRALQERPDPADRERRCVRAHQLSFEEELRELLEGRFELAHGRSAGP